MKIIGVFNSKGGSGKSTLSVHIGVAAAFEFRVALLDADPQGTLRTWGNARQIQGPSVIPATADSLPSELARLERQGVEFVLVDCPPYITAESSRLVSLCDFIVVPVQPTMPDVAGVAPAVKIIQACNKPFGFVINRPKPRMPETAEAVEALSKWSEVCKVMLGDRIAFSRAMASGLSVAEFGTRGEARKEADGLAKWVMAKTKEA